MSAFSCPDAVLKSQVRATQAAACHCHAVLLRTIAVPPAASVRALGPASHTIRQSSARRAFRPTAESQSLAQLVIQQLNGPARQEAHRALCPSFLSVASRLEPGAALLRRAAACNPAAATEFHGRARRTCRQEHSTDPTGPPEGLQAPSKTTLRRGKLANTVGRAAPKQDRPAAGSTADLAGATARPQTAAAGAAAAAGRSNCMCPPWKHSAAVGLFCGPMGGMVRSTPRTSVAKGRSGSEAGACRAWEAMGRDMSCLRGSPAVPALTLKLAHFQGLF